MAPKRLAPSPARERDPEPARRRTASVAPLSEATRDPAPVPAAPRRLLALDAFRGVAIAAMILVNTPGSPRHRFPVLEHADWHGWTPADLIFPAFLFIVGVAITLALGGARDRGAAGGALVARIVRRAVLLFCVGLFLNAFPTFDLAHLRVPGVLQRIALCFAIGSIATLYLSARAQAALAAGLLVVHTAALWLVPPLLGTSGWLGPESNPGAMLDRALLGGHLLRTGWDPEGLLGTLTASATTLAGVLAGTWWTTRRALAERVAGLFAAGTIAVVAGLAFDAALPINKSLWTASFVVFSGGVSLLGLALCAWSIDLCGWRRWTAPFVVYGRNPLLAYVLSALSDKALLWWTVVRPDGSRISAKALVYQSVFLRIASGPRASLLYALVWVAIWLVPLAVLHRRGILLRL
ncbi:MAG TPA: heparan-alpha-glucosaminide N-acetyltransferase domain-containing protein [Candidatus Binatia bacterium]|nr:heparan-alpha-glucosaminide N-acetyltransferase domain-containing protein [Candidatus Binatia bacterium]